MAGSALSCSARCSASPRSSSRSKAIRWSKRSMRVLPQTQCGQCGYPGCRPYAEAIAKGEADINQCPPGGEEGIRKLADLLGRRTQTVRRRSTAPKAKAVAIIDEQTCIGCTLCIQACPVDAIVGAAKQMHTVIAAECTGCELCVAPCPVDCIRMAADRRRHRATGNGTIRHRIKPLTDMRRAKRRQHADEPAALDIPRRRPRRRTQQGASPTRTRRSRSAAAARRNCHSAAPACIGEPRRTAGAGRRAGAEGPDDRQRRTAAMSARCMRRLPARQRHRDALVAASLRPARRCASSSNPTARTSGSSAQPRRLPQLAPERRARHPARCRRGRPGRRGLPQRRQAESRQAVPDR